MELLGFQKECIEKIIQFNGRSLIAAEMGLGKTIVALYWAKANPQVFPMIVLCPAVVKYHWENEAKAAGLTTTVLEGQTVYEAAKEQIIILNYDILRFWVDKLRSLKPNTVVIDESQNLQDSRTKKTKATKKLCKGISNILALSGTPLNRPIEFFSTLNILWPFDFSSRWTYCHRYCDPKHRPWGWEFKGATNTKELHEKLVEKGMLRYRTCDVMKDMPLKTRCVNTIPLTNPNEYRQATDNFREWLQKRNPKGAKRALKAEAMTKIGYLLRLSARLKMQYVIDWANEFLANSDEKLVLFAIHKQMITGLKEGIKAKSVVVDGSIIGPKRFENIEQFQNDKKTRLFIGNIKAASTGITLTAANYLAVCELPWQPATLLQVEKRIHRIGTTKPCWIYYLIAKDTLESKLCSVLQEKQKVMSAIIDGGEQETDLDIYSQLTRDLLKGK